VEHEHNHIDKPEPRWQALLAFLAVGAIYLALPRSLIIGPIWLLPTLIVLLLVPTVISHRTGKRSLNRALGIIIAGESITLTSLIVTVPAHVAGTVDVTVSTAGGTSNPVEFTYTSSTAPAGSSGRTTRPRGSGCSTTPASRSGSQTG